MKTTLEISDELFRRTKATAALRGESLKDFVTAALEAYLERSAPSGAESGWRSVFGKAAGEASGEDLAAVDAAIGEEFERIDLDTWK